MGLPLNFILGASKIIGSISNLLFLVSANFGVEVGSIFVVDSGVVAGWVVCTTVAVESSFVLKGSMVCTMVAVNPDIAASWVVCTTVVVEFGLHFPSTSKSHGTCVFFWINFSLR
ncbi:hypothetical protein NC652_022116 [Populus alba x Populus x berolinensis]|uniref:Transmembrane protein n=1 Tax=Populus alba x Populus x berolinensis TaxID=444605 RepID=A0AAD6VUC6_9ROSI|nr:hypothetical protein NC652_022116 [Populus alba x Populus x berolinensis]KAJ6989239.1 hypothetical protein NC653_021966 [Populus alba x Populus x berolinensis]